MHNREIKAFILIFQLLGIIIFKYPSRKYEFSRFGLSMLCFKFISILIFLFNIYQNRSEILNAKVSVLLVITLGLTVLLIISQIIAIIICLIVSRKIFNVLKSFETFDRKINAYDIPSKGHAYILKLILMKMFLFSFVYRKSLQSCILFCGFFSFIDFFCFVVANLNTRISNVEHIMR